MRTLILRTMSRVIFPTSRSRGGLSALMGMALAVGVIFPGAASAVTAGAETASGVAEVESVRAQLLSGKYADVADVAGAAETTQPEVEDWPLLRAEALMAAGKYPQARDEIAAALE